MISVEEARERILSYVEELKAEKRPILKSLGQVLSEHVFSPLDVPPYDNSAMDGYAVQADDTKGASPSTPRILQVVGEAAAGSAATRPVEPGNAIRIMTGAPIPPGADTVAPFEDTDEPARTRQLPSFPFRIGILKETPVDSNIRRAGEDAPKGGRLLGKGAEIRPSHVGVLASIGRQTVSVVRRPRVAVLATGSELVDIGQPLKPGQLYASNAYSLAAYVQDCGGLPKILGVARDEASALAEKIRQGLDTDMLITSGGVSQGDYDMVKDVLSREGEITCCTVRMKPGEHLALGVLKTPSGRRVPHLGLPGNPVAAMVTFELFARPAILKMMGNKDTMRPTIHCIMEDSVNNKYGRRIFSRVRVVERDGQWFARLIGPQGSGILTSMAQANGLAIISEDIRRVREGDMVPVMLLG